METKTTEIEMDGDYSQVEGVEVTCSRCDHSEQSYGTDERSVKRSAILLRENCPLGENNYYVV
ncbi:MAG: hypothetical protein OXI74_01565 [Rhodospirillaceae bacterium]|nr:hypothetical protein [Rhodospirillaceae bacterium]